MRGQQPNISFINIESSASLAKGLCLNWVVYCQKAYPDQMLNPHLRPAWTDYCASEDSSDWTLYCNSPAIQEAWEMGLFMEAESMNAVNKVSKREYYPNWESLREGRMTKRESERETYGAFVNLEVVLLRYSRSICHKVLLQIVIDVCTDYKYTHAEVPWGLLTPRPLMKHRGR